MSQPVAQSRQKGRARTEEEGCMVEKQEGERRKGNDKAILDAGGNNPDAEE